jgi:hypothetical protein
MSSSGDPGGEDAPPEAHHSADALEIESCGLDTHGYPRPEGSPWSDPAELWIAGANAHSPIEVRKTSAVPPRPAAAAAGPGRLHLSHSRACGSVQAGSEGDASLTRAKTLLGEGEDCEEDEAENFIQEDESGDDDAFDQEWAMADAGKRVQRPGSGMRPNRPDSAALGRRKNPDMNLPRPPCPTMDEFRLPVEGLDPEEAAELRVDAIWPSFVVAYHRLVSRKYAVGPSKRLLQYLQRGYPDYCVEAILNAVKSVTKMRSTSVVGYRRPASAGGNSAADSAPLRLVVLGNYCAELLRTAGHHEDAKKILSKIEILTSVYTAGYEHKELMRVWTLCNMGMLHADKVRQGSPCVSVPRRALPRSRSLALAL